MSETIFQSNTLIKLKENRDIDKILSLASLNSLPSISTIYLTKFYYYKSPCINNLKLFILKIK